MKVEKTGFPAGATRYDPYQTFKFLVRIDSKVVAGVSKVSALTRTTQVSTHREGGSPNYARRSPGMTEYAPVTLERGVTHDLEFDSWANKVWNFRNRDSPDQEISLKDFRKDITIELYNTAGQKVVAYTVYRCWVSEYTALPELDANAGNTIAIQSLKLEHEGWELAFNKFPDEPSFKGEFE